MPAAVLGPVLGSVAGGLVSGGGGGGQTASKEPWEPARKPLENSLATGQDLERFYQQTPFNPLQQQSYQNLFSDLDMFRNQMAPGLMGFANQMMGSQYQRGGRQSQMERMPQMPQMPYGQPMNKPQQLYPDMMGTYMPKQNPLAGIFQAPSQGSYGQLDFRQLNPFTSDAGIPALPPPRQLTDEELADRIAELNRQDRERQDGMNIFAGGN